MVFIVQFGMLQMKTCFEELEKKQLIEERDKLFFRPKKHKNFI